jgi:plastocyanin
MSISNLRRAPLVAAGALAALAVPGSAQQFQYQNGLIPGTARWTEGLEAADADNDGDLDLFVADGDGFSSAGTKRQNVLEINKLIENGILSFADESVARLGVHASNAKGVTTADITGDGYIEALYSNAFNTDPAFLYVNQGAGNPGFFTFEGVARGFTTNVAAGGAMFSDIDDDGDLDVVMNNNYLGSGSGLPRLYENNGSGFFTLIAGAFNAAPAKSSHMDVQMVDIDQNWTVDFFGANRATNGGVAHYLMTNDGAGNFADVSSLIPATSGNVYEADLGDLDGDSDIDLFFVSLSGFADGSMRNNLVPSTTLSFTANAGLGGDDDNEVAYIDFDMDGDYDAFIGSLGAREKLWRNDGNMVWTNSHASIQAVSDSTLDCTVADVNNDGRYDLITGQGESNSAQWVNKVYLNVGGPVDTLAPILTAVKSPATAPKTGPTVVWAKVRDQVLDDGMDYLTGVARYVVMAAPNQVAVSITGGAFVPALSNIPAGSSLLFTNNSGVSQTVTSTTAPYGYDVTIPAGGTYEHFFVAPGTYNFTSLSGGFNGTAQVSGAAATVGGLKGAIQQYRFSMPDTLAGNGVQLVHEIEFTDWAGNVTVSDNGTVVTLVDCGMTTYCTSKPSSLPGCVIGLSTTGTPSASAGSGFTITAGPAPGVNAGLFIYTTQGALGTPLNTPFGFVCIQSPFFRIAGQSAGGTAGVCNGQYQIDFNLFFATQVGDPALVAGSTVEIQCWHRDPPNPGAANTSLAGSFVMCP